MNSNQIARRRLLQTLAFCPLWGNQQLLAEPPTESATRAEVISVSGVPTLVVGGEPIRTVVFETYGPQLRHFKQFADAGTEVFGFSTNAAACDYGHSGTTWVASDTWDYAQFEERAALILQARPDALILPRVNLGTPRWWLADHKDELERFDDGSTVPSGDNPTLPNGRGFPSFASQKWRDAIGGALERLILHVRNSRFGPHVVGWVLSGGHTEEWYHWSCNTPRLAGYSVHTQDAFRRWLSVKYRDDRSLQKAWNRSHVKLSDATVPTVEERRHLSDTGFRDPTTQMNVIDFYLFWNELIPNTIDHFARLAKRACGGEQVVGAFYGYLYEFAGDPEFGHNGVSRLVHSPHIDFMAVTASYFNRRSAKGSDYQRSPATSLSLHGKLWYHDNDVVSYRAKQLMTQRGFSDDNEWTRNRSLQLKLLGYTDSPEQTHWMYRRGWGFAVCHAMHQAWFDLHSGYFDAPDLMDEIKRLNSLASDARLTVRHSIAQILIVVDEASCAYANPKSDLLKRVLTDPQNQLTRIGAPCDHVLLDDLHLVDTDRYRLVMFLNCYHADDGHRTAISGLKRNGKHLVWFGASGLFHNHHRSTEGIEELTGFEFSSKPGGNFSVHTAGNESETATRFRATKDVTFLRSRMSAWHSYYLEEPPIDAAAYRALARQAGVHLYVETNDVLYANASLVVLHAADAGERRIRFPEKSHVADLIRGKTWNAVDEVRVDAKQGETVLLHWWRS